MGLWPWPKGAFLIFFLVVAKELRSSGDRQKIISTPDKPTKVFIGENVSLAWGYYQPSHLTLRHVLFGIFKRPGYLKTELAEVNKNGVPNVRKVSGLSLSWAGNVTASQAVFVLHNVQPAHGNKTFGIQVDFGYEYDMLTDTVRLQVDAKPVVDLPRITYVTTPPLVRTGQNVSLNCTASSISPVNVTWYKGNKVLTAGMSTVVLALENITDKDGGEFLCVANNSVEKDEKAVLLKVLPESPTILNTNKVVRYANWTLQWSAVYSLGVGVTLYTVWHQVVHVTKDKVSSEKPWLRENVTGLLYRKELTADTSYLFAVTAWNRWGESLLERDKVFSISTNFLHNAVLTEHGPSVTPFESNKRSDFTGNEIIIWGAVSTFLCILFTVAVICFVRRQRKRRRETNLNQTGHQNVTGITSCMYPVPHTFSFTSEEDVASVATHGTAHICGSLTPVESALSIPESPSIIQAPTTSVRNTRGDYNQSRTGKCFLLTAVQSELNATAPGCRCHEAPSTFAPHRSSEKSEQNQKIHKPEIHERRNSAKKGMAIETAEASALGVVGEVNQQCRKIQMPQTDSYLQPVDPDNIQGAAINTDMLGGKAPVRPQPKPRIKSLKRRELGSLFQCRHFTLTGTLLDTPAESNPSYDTEAAQHCASVNPVDQSNRVIPKTRTRHIQEHGYLNEITSKTPYQNSLRPPDGINIKSPYTRVLSDTNWEVSRDHLSLIERIGGGSFGQVWKGALFGVADEKGWSIVAVKMLKENSSHSDLRDLLSELDVLKKLKPHPNVIQLLGCFTKDVIRCKGRKEFRPPLVILEFVPHGDLLGYLKKSKGEKDDYYNLRGVDVPQKIPTQQLYKFASDIAQGMEFISAHQLIHRDLAARNVLVGEGLRCKITDFGMARDLGRNDIYVRRSNGLMPVKWMAVESLTSQVYTTKSDVWSYGIVLYEIFTLGENPYNGMTGEEVFTFVASGHRLPRTSAMSSNLYNLMKQCWNEHPSKRPAFGSIVDWIKTLTYDY